MLRGGAQPSSGGPQSDDLLRPRAVADGWLELFTVVYWLGLDGWWLTVEEPMLFGLQFWCNEEGWLVHGTLHSSRMWLRRMGNARQRLGSFWWLDVTSSGLLWQGDGVSIVGSTNAVVGLRYLVLGVEKKGGGRWPRWGDLWL